MAKNAPTTPMSVFKTPIPHFDALTQSAIPAKLLASLTAFDTCLALISRSIAANADVAGWAGDPALSVFSADAADAQACADAALEDFCDAKDSDPQLRTAALLLLLPFAVDWHEHTMLTARGRALRGDALSCASTPLPGNSYKSGRMWMAADLLDQLMEAAQNDLCAAQMHANGLPTIGVLPVVMDIDRVDTFSAPLADPVPNRNRDNPPDLHLT